MLKSLFDRIPSVIRRVGANAAPGPESNHCDSGQRLMTATAKTVLAAAQQRGSEGGLPYFGAVVPAEAQVLLNELPKAQLIDVRTRAEWDYVGRVPGSTLIEWTTYPSGAGNPAF